MNKDELSKMYKNGLISSKPFRYLEIKSKVNQYMASGLTKTESAKKTAKLIGVSEQTVWVALKATNGIDLT